DKHKMKKIIFSCFLLVSVGIYAQTVNKSTVASARTIPFDNGWLFTKDDVSNAEQTDFNDAKWRKVVLPHDWSIEDLPNQNGESVIGPFSKASLGKKSTGHTVGGTAWYRNKFKLNKEEQGKTVYLQFDGVYMNSDVWVNGHHLGN